MFCRKKTLTHTQVMKITPTYRQIETELSQKIRNFYLEKIDFKPQKVTCKLFDKYVVVVADNAVAPIESNLWRSGDSNLIEQARDRVNAILKSELSKLISEALEVEILELISKTAFETNRCIIIAVLSQPPQVRNYRTASSRNK